MQNLLTPAEAAKILKVSVGTLANWRYLKKGPKFRKNGYFIRYSESDLKKFI
jgi:predicted site-specific integrase-resolvase